MKTRHKPVDGRTIRGIEGLRESDRAMGFQLRHSILAAAWIAVPLVLTPTVFGGDVPVDIGTRTQLFVDDYITESIDRVFRVLNQPVKYSGNPVIQLEPPQKVNGKQLVTVSGSVIYDREEKRFKMWYASQNGAV